MTAGVSVPFSQVVSALTRVAGGPRSMRVVLVVATLVVACAADVLTPVELSLASLYLVPLAITTWAFGGRAGLLLAVAAGACALVVERWGAHPYSADYYAYWAACVRITLFAAFVWALDHVKLARDVLLVQSQRDTLTGLYNRRAFTELAQAELQRARRFGRPTSVVFIDVDDFKRQNDTHGHLEGDRILEAIGRALQHGRRFDVPARMGGDEFVLLMPETDEAAAALAFARLHERAIDELARTGHQVTFTAGVATFAVAPDSIADLLRAADQVLYEGKRSGKDSVRAWSQAHDSRAPAAEPAGKTATRESTA
jgi:diguanylate cyclase (GGDEF)-like protein